MINKVILIGNVGADPEIRTLESGVKVARLRLATSERIYSRETQEAKEHTEWHTITVWRNTADFVDRFVRKGSQIYIEGKLRSREWTDQQGNKRYTTEIVADDLKLLGRRPDSGQGSQSGGYSGSSEQSHGGSAQVHGNSEQGHGYGEQSGVQHSSSSQPAIPADDPDDLPF